MAEIIKECECSSKKCPHCGANIQPEFYDNHIRAHEKDMQTFTAAFGTDDYGSHGGDGTFGNNHAGDG